jgi:hypothetical protein
MFKGDFSVEIVATTSTLAQLLRYADVLGRAGHMGLEIALRWARLGKGRSSGY